MCKNISIYYIFVQNILCKIFCAKCRCPWITEHFCIAIDLSPYELTPNSDINLNLTYESWANHYNPFYLNGNEGTNKY